MLVKVETYWGAPSQLYLRISEEVLSGILALVKNKYTKYGCPEEKFNEIALEVIKRAILIEREYTHIPFDECDVDIVEDAGRKYPEACNVQDILDMLI